MATGPGEPPVGIVLAGGESRRMGRDKALLPAAGSTLPERAASRLAAVCPELALADAGRRLLPGRPSLADGPGAGPAAGILGAVAAYPGRALLVLACDLPGVPEALLAELAADRTHDWVLPRWAGRLEPLCALYRPKALAALAAAVAQGLLGPHHLAEDPTLSIRYLDDLTRFGPPDQLFRNLNTPDDLQRWEGELPS